MRAGKGSLATSTKERSWVEPRSANLTVFFACILFLPLYFLYDSTINPAHTFGGVDVNLKISIEDRDGHEKVKRGAPILHQRNKNVAEEETTAGGRRARSRRRPFFPKEGRGSFIECDFSQSRSDTCEIHGDVRIHGPSSSVVLLVPSSSSNSNDINGSSNGTKVNDSPTKIKPYTRKWENHTMLLIRELTLRKTSSIGKLKCEVVHPIGSTAIIFSTGGFRQNFFHEIVDALIPLFLTSSQFHGNVHFLIEDFNPKWANRYLPVIRRLTRHKIINIDADERVHCFDRALVGLNSTMELGIDPAKSPSWGPSMHDFRALLRRSFRLPRAVARSSSSNTNLEEKKKHPRRRVVFVSRKETRVLVNEVEVMEMMRGLGYEVVVAGTETTKNLTLMASVVNSCDVMVGVHGAGLTNMVFLPTNATLIEIIPWGGMKDASKYSYGDPAIVMGLRHLGYEITMNESSLIHKYPRDHPVFTDPMSIHRKGYLASWTIFWHQDVTLDVPRFRRFLSKSL